MPLVGYNIEAQDQAAEAWLRALGRRVRIARLSRELTQQQLADATGVSRSLISLIEKGTHNCAVQRLWRIADALGMPLLELLDVSAR